MTRRRDKPTSFKERLQRATGAMSPEAKDALAKLVSPETKQTIRELAQRFQGEPDDPPAAAPEATPTTSAPIPAPRKPRRGEQTARAKRVLCARVYPPDGKAPHGISAKAVTG